MGLAFPCRCSKHPGRSDTRAFAPARSRTCSPSTSFPAIRSQDTAVDPCISAQPHLPLACFLKRTRVFDFSLPVCFRKASTVLYAPSWLQDAVLLQTAGSEPDGCVDLNCGTRCCTVLQRGWQRMPLFFKPLPRQTLSTNDGSASSERHRLMHEASLKEVPNVIRRSGGELRKPHSCCRCCTALACEHTGPKPKAGCC